MRPAAPPTAAGPQVRGARRPAAARATAHARGSSTRRARPSPSTATTARPSAACGARGVDPALVLHYFGSKEALFGAALELPVQPGEVFARGHGGGTRQLGATVVRTFLEAWEPPETRVRLMAMLRSAMTNEAAMGMIRDLLTRQVFGPITEVLGVPDAQLRATLVGSQFIGLAICATSATSSRWPRRRSTSSWRRSGRPCSGI